MLEIKRGAVKWLNFKGDISMDAVGQVVGPTDGGEHLLAVEAHYDSSVDTTRVGYCYLSTAEHMSMKYGTP